MPMTFTDETLLSFGARLYREKKEDESIEEYRNFVAERHYSRDPVEAHEIKTGKGWDAWTDAEFLALVQKKPELARTNIMVMARYLQLERKE